MKAGIRYIVYDLSIKDLTERKNAAVIYPSARKMALAIGICANKVPLYTDPAAKKRFFSESHKKEFAIRLYK